MRTKKTETEAVINEPKKVKNVKGSNAFVVCGDKYALRADMIYVVRKSSDMFGKTILVTMKHGNVSLPFETEEEMDEVFQSMVDQLNGKR